MKRAGIQLLFFITLIALFSACDKNKVFDQYKTLPQPGWHKDSLLVFELNVTDTLQTNNMYINVRNDIKYKYSNLWLFIEIESPDGTAKSDTFEIVLADPTGKWIGTGFGGIKTNQLMYRRSIIFPVSGMYKINIRHGMRTNLLKGINDLGVRVET
jgi:gliding motility-associated lipoprotein GldH